MSDKIEHLSDGEQVKQEDALSDCSSTASSDSATKGIRPPSPTAFNLMLKRGLSQYSDFVELCEEAFKLNLFDKIGLAVSEFEKFFAVPSNIWVRYLKVLDIVTQTPKEQALFDKKSSKALASFYDTRLAAVVVSNLIKQPIEDKYEIWANLLADYGLESHNLVGQLREKLEAITDANLKESIEKIIKEKCVTYNSDSLQLQKIAMIIAEFKQELEATSFNSGWLQNKYILKADKLALPKNLTYSLAKFFYECSITKYSSDENLWLDYFTYMQKNSIDRSSEESVKDGFLLSEPFNVIERALLVEPTYKLNHKYLALMEHNNYTVTQIDQALDKLFARVKRQMDLCVEMYLDYLAYRVRNLNTNDEDQIEHLRSTFRRIWDRLSDQYGVLADANYEVLQLWAQVEYAKLKCPHKAEDIWHEILHYEGSSEKSCLWQTYAEMDSEFNDRKNLRVILKKALVALPREDTEQVAHLYRRYERCFGTADTIAECQAYCLAYSPTFLCNWSTKGVISSPMGGVSPGTFKYSPHLEENKIFIKNLNSKCTTDQVKDIFKAYGTIEDIRLVYSTNNKFKGIAYIEYATSAEATRAVIRANGLEVDGRNIFVAISNPPSKQPSAAGAVSKKVPQPSPFLQNRGRKRRFPTTLIPTTVVMQKRRKMEMPEIKPTNSAEPSTSAVNGENSAKDNGDAAKDTGDAAKHTGDAAKDTGDAAKKTGDAAMDTGDKGDAAVAQNVNKPTAEPKSNDDFRKLFLK